MTTTREELSDLRASLRAMLERRCASERVREVAESAPGVDLDLWALLARDMGVPAMTVPEESGGIGAGPEAVAVVAEELGRALAPVPFFSSAVLATTAFTRAGGPRAAEWLPRLAEGAIGTVAVTGADGVPGVDRLDVRATVSGERIVLDGTAGFVPDAEVAEVLVVAARSEHGPVVAAVEPGAVVVEPVVVHDRTRRLSTVRLTEVSVPRADVLAEGDSAVALLAAVYRHGAAALAADAAGGARRLHEMAVQYAKDRVQFDRPIGSFQAVKHKLADMYVLVEGAAAAAGGAAEAAAGDDERALALTASFAVEAYTEVAGDAIQVHGGIGYTWEHDCHLFFKRAQLDEALFGSAAWLRARAAEALTAV
ncbi:alkylation response protein AidB-like acyl-CoA dehydrogenase [Amycolatopsis bartoniae]|uniref:Acyl-CoA dehydrogenase n=1 Tax=Amycolatopsis bartoniae TaxID=941986 RepID=A0A8H9M363_9PSEU|nr:acyl-CoA dehydrogenase family protein [Amycolatopsis bartoniae]MBB2939738.1 alkylation response protein AidB-like acyl-CoA dehydrogenase [Amycolatopsis bartoniae]TVT08364.1 acyl-CoA dehydrogenase [Amycolatopsis bartoniae]GHF36146.1 acyl-CoA dehydrogenase [Amycolatopsis bartoniae]